MDLRQGFECILKLFMKNLLRLVVNGKVFVRMNSLQTLINAEQLLNDVPDRASEMPLSEFPDIPHNLDKC